MSRASTLEICRRAKTSVSLGIAPLVGKFISYLRASTRQASVPYHIGNGWGGGLVPFITTAAFAATGSIGYALIYPIAVPAVCFVLALFRAPETRKISIWEPIEPRTA
jgi:hypothetical protein